MQENEEKARSEKPNLRDLQRETYFSNSLVVPAVHAYLCKCSFASVQCDGCKALLAEGYVNFREIASGSPMSAFKQPFTKQFNTVGSIVKSWWGSPKEAPASNACPDFALRHPCPYTVVGETKYFRKGGAEAAKTELVRGIYQCCYYRWLPKASSSWDYDYSCLLAYDASRNGVLAKAWETVNSKVKDACWNGANVLPSA